MPPRLRSKPYGPNSPNAAEGLPDPAPRRRRATRSASAQPQEDQPAPPVREPKTRKTRGKAASRGKKKATRRTSPSPSLSPPATPQPDQLEGDDTTSGAVAQAPSEKVESPIVELGASQEHDEPHGASVDEPAVDQVQGVQLEGHKADQSAAEQIRAELEMHIPASPSVEIPVTVLPSIESNDPEVTTSSPGVCESPTSFFSLRSSPASFFSVRSSSVVSAASTPSDSSSSTTSTSTEVSGNQRRSWLMIKLRSLFRLCTRSHDAPVSPAAAAITAPAVGWSLEIPVLILNTGESQSALDDIELISILRAVRSTGTGSNRRPQRRPRASLSPSSSEQSRVLRAQGATPIHRSRTSYASRSNSRRIESRGSLGRTLYRLPQLLSFHSEPKLQDGSGEGTNPAHEQDSLNFPPATVVPETTPPATPERLAPATPVAPMTAPPAGTDVSPGWSRWIFNGVSRRWTVLRGRLAHDHENETESQPAVAAADQPAVPTASASPAEAVRVAPASTSESIPAVVSGPFVAPNARYAPTNTLAFPPVDRDQGMSPLIRDPSRSPPPRRVLPLPRPRRRTMSFMDTRTLLAAGDPTFVLGEETQHEFVKRRQAARVALARQKLEAKNREIAAARYAAAAAATAAQEAARRKPYASSNPPKETPASVSGGSPVTSNTGNRGPRTSPRLIPTASSFQIAPASRGRASEEATAQTAAKRNVDAEKLNPRKRNRGFGLDEDDLAVHEEDFTDEEWETLKAQVEKAEEDAAKAAQESAPPTKKRRVDTSKQQKRTQPLVRSQNTGTPRQTQPPARTPGFVPNRRGTIASPDLSPIDSSGLLTDPDSPSISQTPQASTQPLETNEVPRSTPQNRSKPRRGTTAQTQASLSTQKGTIIHGVFVPHCDSSTQGFAQRTPSPFKIPKFGWTTTPSERRAKRNKPSPYLAFLKSFREREQLQRKEAATPLKTEAEKTPKKRVRWKDLEPAQNREIWHDRRRDFSAPTTPASVARPVRQPSQTSRTFEDAFLAASSPASSPNLPTPLRPAIKRKREFEAADPEASSSAPDLSSSSRRPVKRSRGYEAPDPYASSSSPSSASPSAASPSAASPSAASPSAASPGPSAPPPRSPYDAGRHFASLQPGGHSLGVTDANLTTPETAATEDPDVESEDPSPLSRARNKAELFKPKTPSRLRESTRIPNSNASTPSALGFSSPSFLGVSMDNSPYCSDPMSVDGSSFISNPDTTPVGTQAATNETIPSDSRPNAAVRTVADDVAWLLHAIPNGDFDELPWPARRSLAEVLNVDSEAVAVAERYWQEKGADLVNYFEALFEA